MMQSNSLLYILLIIFALYAFFNLILYSSNKLNISYETVFNSAYSFMVAKVGHLQTPLNVGNQFNYVIEHLIETEENLKITSEKQKFSGTYNFYLPFNYSKKDISLLMKDMLGNQKFPSYNIIRINEKSRLSIDFTSIKPGIYYVYVNNNEGEHISILKLIKSIN